jgi:hypothetical protein
MNRVRTARRGDLDGITRRVAMQDRKAFFSGAIAAAALLLAGISASAAAQPASSCRVGDFQFTVSSGPSFVPCDFSGGQCTEIEYRVLPSPGTVYALQGKGVVGVSNEGQAFKPCEGVGSFGRGSCHEQAVRTSPDDSGRFKITLAGLRRASPTSVAIGVDPPQACEIVGIGLENSPNPEEATQATETIDFKGCVVEFTRNPATGEVVSARLTRDSPEDCTSPFLGAGRTLLPQPVADLEIRLKDGKSLGKGNFGDGYISTGKESCTTRVIGGRVYTWGAPCP